MKLISKWQLFHKRWSTWILSAIPTLTAAHEFVPQIQDYVPGNYYKIIMCVLAVAVFVAIQIKQKSLSEPPQ